MKTKKIAGKTVKVETLDIKAVPTNIISGFLGVGKTTAILHLLKSKPENEHWAVLVNEFGEIGLDGSLLGAQHSEQTGVFIREVPGGCMCCASGLPMQIALNQLLIKSRPDRLLIEPTGLGHPKEVLNVLSSQHYQQVLSLQRTITLVDARVLADQRYTANDTFNQQISMADIIVGNKADLYQDEDKARLCAYANAHGNSQSELYFCQQGELPLGLLQGEVADQFMISDLDHHHHHHENSGSNQLAGEQAIPACGFIKAQNSGEGFVSVGWIFAAEKIFDQQRLMAWLKQIDPIRLKAVFITNAGCFSYNLTPDGLTVTALTDCLQSRIEVISQRLDESLEARLMACIA